MGSITSRVSYPSMANISSPLRGKESPLARSPSYEHLTHLSEEAYNAAEKAYEIGRTVIPGLNFRVLGNNLTDNHSIQASLGMFAVDPCPKAQRVLHKALSYPSMPSDAESKEVSKPLTKCASAPAMHAHFSLREDMGTEHLFSMVEQTARSSPAVKGYFSSGAILNDQNWTVPFNDAFLLSGIHEGIDFHIAIPTPKPTEQNLWDSKANRPRVFARELAMLRAAGYTHHAEYKPDGELLGIVFRKSETESKHETITLEECLTDFEALEAEHQTHEKDPAKLKPAAEREATRKAFIEGLQEMFSCGATI